MYMEILVSKVYIAIHAVFLMEAVISGAKVTWCYDFDFCAVLALTEKT